MHIDGYDFLLDKCAKFYCTLFLEGWFYHPSDQLVDIEIIESKHFSENKHLSLDHPAVASLGAGLGFQMQLFFREENLKILDAKIRFKTSNGKLITVSLADMSKDRIMRSNCNEITKQFRVILEKNPGLNLLDIGGRDRSGIDRSKAFPNANVTVLDILPGQNVNVVGDAHALSEYFPPSSFDVVYSISVFEHLIQPWKVALEINKVLKLGGIGLVFSHQTIGMHDLPWDYFRFSNTAWDALFNKRTGFEILARSLDYEQFVVPFMLRPEKITAEKSAGFEGSLVLFKKIGTTNLSWDVSTAELTNTTYPDTKDNNFPDKTSE